MRFLNSRQLQQKVKTKAQQLDNVPPVAVMQNVAMEHFIRRLSASEYKDKFIIKGGVLVSSLVGVNNRTTMDLDATIKNLHLSEENLKEVLSKIGNIDLDDGFTFSIGKIEQIREEAEYAGIRMNMTAHFDRTRQPFHLDISTADVITPHEIDYELPSLFSEPIPIKAYPLETLLAEKLETILSRDVANTRMRDFYDVGILLETKGDSINYDTLFKALENTTAKRGTTHLLGRYASILENIKNNSEMQRLWNNYANGFVYAQKYKFEELCDTASSVFDNVFKGEKQISFEVIDSLYAENPIGDDDWFYNHPDKQAFEAVYFNPNSNAGGQYVIMTLPYDLIKDAARQTNDAQRFFEMLEERASYTELVDITDKNFRDTMESYKNSPADYVGRTDDVMSSLVSQCGREAKTTSMSDYASRIAERKARDAGKTASEAKAKAKNGKDRSE